MINFIRAGRRGLALSMAMLAVTIAGCAHDGAPRGAASPTSPAPRLTDDPGYTPARPVPARSTDDLDSALRDSAPARYVVRAGDTLWDIAARYLRSPWYWRQLWQANPDIDDPDRIYPGDVLVLSRDMDGTPHLLLERRTVRLSPRVRVAPLDQAITTIPIGSLRAFLQSPRRVDASTLANAPYVVAVGDGQLVAGNDALLYIRGLEREPAAASSDGQYRAVGTRYALVRADGAYRDRTEQKDLGARALPVGQVEILDAQQPASVSDGLAALYKPHVPIATARFVDALREARPGDRLLPVADAALASDFVPRTPAAALQTHIIDVYGGISQIGRYDVVALANDAAQPLTRGDVLEIYQASDSVIDPVTAERVRLPERRAGRLMVFESDQSVSYALVMRAERAIHVGDIARSPTGGA